MAQAVRLTITPLAFIALTVTSRQHPIAVRLPVANLAIVAVGWALGLISLQHSDAFCETVLTTAGPGNSFALFLNLNPNLATILSLHPCRLHALNKREISSASDYDETDKTLHGCPDVL